MVHKQFKDLSLSALGFGSMRLPCIGGDDGAIDKAAVNEMVDYAIAHGVNYFDTAWGYHNGNSETVMGEALSRYDRNRFNLATKFPGYDLKNMGKTEQIFSRQLEKCRVDYFDFYLVHNVCEMNIDAYLNEEKYGTLGYLLRKREEGKIKHLGFSVHGNLDVLRRFLDAYGLEMEFCQIQLNWLDYSFQNAKAKIELLNEWGLPIWVMEPLRGGKLCKLNDDAIKTLEAIRPDKDAVDWSFRYLQSIPSVTMILSGMSNLNQIKRNIEIFDEDLPLSPDEQVALYEIARRMTQKASLPCTACKYCVSHCPKGLNIPNIISLYNEHFFTGGGFIAPMALSALDKDKRPSACIGCHSCEKVCPQNIKIATMMSDFNNKLKGV